MAIKFHNPKSVALTGKYSLGVEVPSDARLLFLAGQVGYDSKGRLAPSFEKQCDLTWKNIGQILKSAGMGYSNIVQGHRLHHRFALHRALPRRPREVPERAPIRPRP